MKKLFILIALFAALSSQAQLRLHGNGFYNIRSNIFGWLGTGGTDSIARIDSAKIKLFKPVLPGSYTTAGAPSAALFPGYIIYNTDSVLPQYSNGTTWLNLPGVAGGGGGGGSGDFSSNTATSVDNEIVLFSSTGGKTGKRATQTGILLGTSGVLSATTTSSGISGAISDETGSGALVFGTTPTFTTSIISPIIIGGTGTTDDLIYRSTSGSGTTGADHIWQGGTNGGTELMRMLNNGSLGIGLNNPSERLHIYRDADVMALMQFQNPNSGTSAAGGVKLSTNGGDSYIYRTSNAYVSSLGDKLVFQEAGGGDMVWFTANEKMRLLNNGNFGIGINNPANVLDVLHGSQPQLRLTTTATTSYTTLQGSGGNLYLNGNSITNTMVALGGSTSSFPGIQRNAANTRSRLADNSANTDHEVADEAYDATAWNASVEVPTKNAVRDKIESMSSGSATVIYQFAGTQAVTVTNTTTETTIYGTGTGSAGIDGTANVTTGTQIILKGAGTINTDGAVAGEVTFAFKFPTSTVSLPVTGLANGLTGSTYTYEYKAIPLGTGTSQDYIWFIDIFVENNGTPVIIKVTGRETGVLTTTGTLTMNVTVDWNTADTDNTVASNFNTIEIIKK